MSRQRDADDEEGRIDGTNGSLLPLRSTPKRPLHATIWTLRMKAGCSGAITVAIGRPTRLPGMTFEAPLLRALPIRIPFFVGAIMMVGSK